MRPTKALQSKSNQIEIISRFFDPDRVEHLARESKFVQRESLLSGMDFLLLCMFAHQKTEGVSLEDMCGELCRQGVYITKQSLQDRFNGHAVEFVNGLLNEALSIKLNASRLAAHTVFRRIVIWDSTQIELPEAFGTKYRGHGGGASAGALKIQYGYDLLSQKTIALLVQSAVQPDHAQGLEGLEENDLRIEDLGYFNLQRLERIAEGNAFFLSRYRFGVLLFEQENPDEQIDLLKLERSMKAAQRITMRAFIGSERKLPVRLIIEKVPQQVASEKRRKLRYDPQIKRKSLSRKRLKLCNLSIYITNTTEQQLSSEQLRDYYSLRWQIEIIFKSWKSVYRIERTKPMKLHRFECMLLGTLILIAVTTSLMAACRIQLLNRYSKELSEFRFFKLIKSSLDLLQQAIRSNRKLLEFFVLLEKMAIRHAIKQIKANKPTPLDILYKAA